MTQQHRWSRLISTGIGAALFIAAVVVLRREMQAVTWQALVADAKAIAPAQLGWALALTVVNYAVLTGYDLIAFAYIGRTINRWKVVVASFLAYAIANNVGFALVSGASVRYRFYTRWGVTAGELSRIVFSYSVTFWLGLLCLGGLGLATHPWPPGALSSGVAAIAVPTGWILMASGIAYVIATAVRRTPISIGRVSLRLPPPSLAAAQLIISVLDWALAAAVLYVLLPIGSVSFLTVVAVFVTAQLIALVSHVPGGIGVFESLVVLLLSPYLTSDRVLPALVLYRFIYYLLPLAVAVVGLAADEIRQSWTADMPARFGEFTERITPRVLAFFIFLAGLVLLFSGATPAAAGRLNRLSHFVPLGVVETSHFIGSFVGTLLILLSQAVARRLDAAMYLSAAGLAVGILASLFKGGDYEEATLLAVLLGALLRARSSFDRRAAIFAARFSRKWIVAVIAALASSIWLMFFAFKNVQYSNQLWWQFQLHSEASRSLRATVGAITVVFVFALARLIGHAPHEKELPADADLDTAGTAIAAQRSTYPYLVYLRDKGLLFNAERTGFVMYAVRGRTWASMGDPVGPPEAIPGLVRQFVERADDFGGTPVFYEVRRECLHHYADLGLTFAKLGEEARVNLQTFTFDGGKARGYRQALSRLEKEGCSFRVVLAAEVGPLLPRLREVSDDWMEARPTGEKGFSLGFFDEEYLARFPVAIIERGDQMVAFANIWPGPGGSELSVDLMRYRQDAPKNIMESLIVSILRWGKNDGYQWFGLGMAPMSGFERSPVAPLWSRLGRLVYAHGGRIYNFQGLRAFKDKFDPVWEPYYLAYPGRLRLARVLADISAIVAGGYRKILLK